MRVLYTLSVAAGAYVAWKVVERQLKKLALRAERMNGKVAIVTGGTSGVGREAVKRLVKNGVQVVLAARDMALGAAVVKELQSLAPPNHKEPVAHCIHCDLSSLASVKQFATDFKKKGMPLNILLLNAGMCPATNQPPVMTADGYEAAFQTNHLSHFLLTRLLVDELRGSAPSRVIVVSSSLHSPANQHKGAKERPSLPCGSIEELRADWQNRHGGMLLYRNSKLANVLFAYELNRKLKKDGVFSNALSPGFIPSTGLSRNQGAGVRFFMSWIMPNLPFKFIRTADSGADCIEYVCTNTDVEGVGGLYFADSRPAPSSEDSQSEELAQKLWALSEEAVQPFL